MSKLIRITLEPSGQSVWVRACDVKSIAEVPDGSRVYLDDDATYTVAETAGQIAEKVNRSKEGF